MTASLSIGVVCFPSLGGSGVVASEIAVGLARRRHRVHVIATARPVRTMPDVEDLQFHAVAMPEHPVMAQPPYDVAIASKIVDVCRENRLDLVLVHYAVPHAASAMLAREVLGAAAPAFVTSLHGTDVTRLGSAPAYRSVIAHAVAASDGITVPSRYLCREAHERLGIPESRSIEVLPNFVDTDHFAPPQQRDRGRFAGLCDTCDEGPVLFHVSNFRAVKRVSDLLEVLARVRRVVPARLVLVGDGPERARAEERAEALGLTGSVCFLGKRLDFAEHLRHADAFVLTSETESFGVAALEALSSGVPVFAYRVGGLPELVVERVGRLVPPLDVDALARAVLEVVTEPGLRAELGHAARAHALAGFQREPALDRYESYFRRVLGNRNPESR
jgi:N-acetyl-alpha-D-glucosaminyl L-malate synthase BshA